MHRAALLLGVLLAGCAAPAGSPAASAPPVALAALGDSLMAGYNADAEHAGTFPEVSWPTANASWSFASRLGAASAENFARPAEKLSGLPGQAAQMTPGAFALVGFGANDLCTGGGREEMTVVPVPTAEFEAALRGHVAALQESGSRVLLVTIPDIVAMHEVAPMPPPQEIGGAYLAFGVNCGRTPDQFRADIGSYNEAILRVAADLGTMSDGGAIARMEWTRAMVSELDGVHPSIEGAQAMATAVWDAYSASATS